MTRKLQHLFSRATLLLLLFFVSGVTFAQDYNQTIKLEIEGEGSADFEYNDVDGSVKNGTLNVGENHFNIKEDMSYGFPIYIINVYPKAASGYKLSKIYEKQSDFDNWTEKPEWITEVENNGFYPRLIFDPNQKISFKIVFEKTEEDVQPTQTYTVDVVGQGTVDYSYTSESGDVKTGTFVPGEAVGFDNMSMGAAYIIDITPKPAEGYKFAGMKMNGEEVADALQQYNEIGMVTLETAATDVKLEVTFKEDVPEYNVIYTVTVEGEGTADYRYYYDDGTNPFAEAKGTFEIGVATGLNPKLMGSNYGVDIYPKPAEGYKFVNALVNGTEVKNAVSKYEDFGYFPVNSSEKEIALHLVYEKEAVENPYTYTVTIEGEGSVDYYYLVDKTLAEVRGTIEPGVPLPANPIPSVGINFTPNPAEGYEFTAAYVDGVEDEDAKGQIEMFGYFNVIPQSSEVNVKIVFTKTVELPEEYDMIVNYTQEGEGQVDYFYFIIGTESASGPLAEGLNVFPEMFKSSSVGYNLTLTPKPAQGYELEGLYVNDKKVTVGGSGYRYTTKVDKETVNVKAVFRLPAATLVYEAETAEGKISVTDAEGNVLESGSECAVGANVSIVVTPTSGYVLKSLKAGETELTVGEPVDGTYTVPYTMVEGENKIVAEFETTLEPDMYVNLTVEEGEGHIEYWYYLAEPLDATQEGIFSEGLNKLYNMYYSKISNYSVYVTVVPAEGYTLKSLYIGQTDYSAWYGPNEEFSLMSTSKGDTYEIKVKFEKEAEKADMIVNYTQEGNGNMSYFYYTDDADATGYMEEGSNEFWDMYLDSYGNYKMYLTATPEEGSILKSLTVDGVDKTAEYNESGNLMLTSTGGQTFDVKAVFEGEEPEPTGHKVVIRANGDIEYHIKFSNTAEQKQEFYYVSDKDTTVYLPDNAFCGWNYTYNPNFTVKNLLINGEPLLEPTFTVTSDLEISLDYVETGYYELEFEQPENGEIIVEYQVYDMEVYDYVYVPYEAGLTLQTGTGYRVTYIADEDSYIANVKVNGEEVMTSTIEDPVYEFVYEENVWGPVSFEAEILTEISVDEVAAEPVQMTVYSVDGVLVRSCLAKDAKEAVEGLAKGLYIVNGQKVVVK